MAFYYSKLHDIFYNRAFDQLLSCINTGPSYSTPRGSKNSAGAITTSPSLQPLSSSPRSLDYYNYDHRPSSLDQGVSWFKQNSNATNYSSSAASPSTIGTTPKGHAVATNNTSANDHQLSNSFQDSFSLTSSNLSNADLNRKDWLGRTVLHLIAASPDPDLYRWAEVIIRCKGTNINVQDTESGWTALHRAMYAGNIVVALFILSHPQVEIGIKDNEGLTAFDVYNSTVYGTNPSEGSMGDLDLFTWGTNRNYVLGVPGDGDKPVPDMVSLPDPITSKNEQVQVSHVEMSKLHSAIVTNELGGTIRLCGFGSGGRLGQTSRTQFAFELLPNKPRNIVQVALGQDHTAFINNQGELFTFGLGTRGQLGYVNENETSNKEFIQGSPRRVVGILKKEFVKLVCASRLHTACVTLDGSVYTWGTNKGQLGYPSNTVSMQPTPRKVPSLPSSTAQMVASDVATAIVTEEGEVWVLYSDNCTKISFAKVGPGPSSNSFASAHQKTKITKISISGHHCIALSSLGDLYYWSLDHTARDIKPQLVWDFRRSFTAVADACLCDDSILLCTKSGHVFLRSRRLEVKASELRSNANSNFAPLSSINGSNNTSYQNTSASSSFPNNSTISPSSSVSVSNKKFYQVKRIPFLQRIINVSANSSGSFAAIRADVMPIMIERKARALIDGLIGMLPHIRQYGKFPSVIPSHQLTSSRKEDDIGDDNDNELPDLYDHEIDLAFHICALSCQWDTKFERQDLGTDICIIIGDHRVYSHQAILATRSEVLEKILHGSSYHLDGIKLDRSRPDEPARLIVSRCSLLTMLLFLHYLYTDNVIAISDNRVVRELREKLSGFNFKVAMNVINDELLRLAQTLKLPHLAFALGSASKRPPPASLCKDFGKLMKSSTWNPDIILELSNNQTYPIHSIILRPQSSFFDAIFSSNWIASSKNEDAQGRIAINLRHLKYQNVDIAIRHAYLDLSTDELFEHYQDTLSHEDFLDLVFDVMAVANELILDRLKEVCSELLCQKVNINNVCSILAEAEFLEARSLQRACEYYIAGNLETMLESHLLDSLSTDQISQFATYVRQRQVERLPFTKSGKHISSLMEKHSEWLSEQDMPRPVVGRNWRLNKSKVAKSNVTSPNLLPQNEASPLLAAQSTKSPSISPEEDEMPFEMDSFDQSQDKSILINGSSPSIKASNRTKNKVWGKLTKEEAIPPLDLRQIMQTETDNERKPNNNNNTNSSSNSNSNTYYANSKSAPNANATVVNSTVRSNASNVDLPYSRKMSQKERRKLSAAQQQSQQQEALQPKRAAWVNSSASKPSLSDIQFQEESMKKKQESALDATSPSRSVTKGFTPNLSSLNGTPPPAQAHARMNGFHKQPNDQRQSTPIHDKNHHLNNPASAVGAPIISPERMTGPVQTQVPAKNDSPWGKIVAPYKEEMKSTQGESFLSITLRQEQEALDHKPQPRSLLEIQQEAEKEAREEKKRSEEEQRFLKWWEEESARVIQQQQQQQQQNGKRQSGQGTKKTNPTRNHNRPGGSSNKNNNSNSGNDNNNNNGVGVGGVGNRKHNNKKHNESKQEANGNLNTQKTNNKNQNGQSTSSKKSSKSSNNDKRHNKPFSQPQQTHVQIQATTSSGKK